MPEEGEAEAEDEDAVSGRCSVGDGSVGDGCRRHSGSWFEAEGEESENRSPGRSDGSSALSEVDPF